MPGAMARQRSTRSWKLMVQRFRYLFLDRHDSHYHFIRLACIINLLRIGPFYRGIGGRRWWYQLPLMYRSMSWTLPNYNSGEDRRFPRCDFPSNIQFGFRKVYCIWELDVILERRGDFGANCVHVEQGTYVIAKWNGTKVSVKILDRESCSDPDAM